MHAPKNPHLRAAIEVGFIIFLFYSNLLMGEFTRTTDHGQSLSRALLDIFTLKTIAVAIVTSIVGHLALESLREKTSASR
jgi:hypothetical protein